MPDYIASINATLQQHQHYCIAPEFLSDDGLFALQLGFLTVAYPSLVITYLGQAAYLMINPDNYATTFYACIPSPVYWPVFVIAVLAAIVASQVKNPHSWSLIETLHKADYVLQPWSDSQIYKEAPGHLFI